MDALWPPTGSKTRAKEGQFPSLPVVGKLRQRCPVKWLKKYFSLLMCSCSRVRGVLCSRVFHPNWPTYGARLPITAQIKIPAVLKLRPMGMDARHAILARRWQGQRSRSLFAACKFLSTSSHGIRLLLKNSRRCSSSESHVSQKSLRADSLSWCVERS